MREILFKAKRKDNGEWVEGYYQKRFSSTSPIIEGVEHLIFKSESPTVWEYARIDKTTLCQYTGLTDKNGNKIWENDVVKDDRGNIYKAFWQESYYQFSWICVKSDLLPIGARWDLWSLSRNGDLEVIGNIFDNPELIKECD